MPTTQKEILSLAKQGNSEAIAALMKAILSKSNIDVKVERFQENLSTSFSISLIGEQSPDKKKSISFVEKGMRKLDIPGVQLVIIHGYKAGIPQNTWAYKLKLESQKTFVKNSKKDLGTIEKRKYQSRHTIQGTLMKPVKMAESYSLPGSHLFPLF